MTQLKLRFKFNPGRTGAPMDKLGDFSVQCEKFLRSLTYDLGVQVKKGQWLAQNFSNGSVEFDSIFAESVPDNIAQQGIQALIGLSGQDPVSVCNKGLIGYGTLAEFAKIGKSLDPDESYYIKLDYIEHSISDWREISYGKSAEIRKLLEAPFISSGSFQGVPYSWHSGARPSFFQAREIVNGALVHCTYEQSIYLKVHNAFKKLGNIMHVYGDITWDKPTNSIIDVAVKDIEITSSISEAEFEKLFGSMSNYTGDFGTADYIDWVRGDAE